MYNKKEVHKDLTDCFNIEDQDGYLNIQEKYLKYRSWSIFTNYSQVVLVLKILHI